MDIMVSKQAANFFKREMDFSGGKGLRIKAKSYGSTNVHTYMSVAVEATKPRKPIAMTEEAGLSFFVEESEAWFVAGLDLEIDYNAAEGIPTYYFMAQDNRVLDNSDYTRNYPPQHFM